MFKTSSTHRVNVRSMTKLQNAFPSHRYQKLHMEQLLEVVEGSCKNSEVIKLELRGSWWGRYYSTLSRVIAAALNWYVFR